MNIPEEAVEAGARASFGKVWDHATPEDQAMWRGIVAVAVGAAAPLIAAQVLRGRVAVNVDDLTTVLNQRNGHCHSRPGIWDDDNRPGLAGTRCVECAARERLMAAARIGSTPDPDYEGHPCGPAEEKR